MTDPLAVERLNKAWEKMKSANPDFYTRSDFQMFTAGWVAQLAAQPSVQRDEMWVSCKQELPAYGRAVWVVWNGVVQNMAYSRDVGEWRPACDDSDTAPDGTFSHWMYKIEPPKFTAERGGLSR